MTTVKMVILVWADKCDFLKVIKQAIGTKQKVGKYIHSNISARMLEQSCLEEQLTKCRRGSTRNAVHIASLPNPGGLCKPSVWVTLYKNKEHYSLTIMGSAQRGQKKKVMMGVRGG